MLADWTRRRKEMAMVAAGRERRGGGEAMIMGPHVGCVW
jgi:hypothetical protein